MRLELAELKAHSEEADCELEDLKRKLLRKDILPNALTDVRIGLGYHLIPYRAFPDSSRSLIIAQLATHDMEPINVDTEETITVTLVDSDIEIMSDIQNFVRDSQISFASDNFIGRDFIRYRCPLLPALKGYVHDYCILLDSHIKQEENIISASPISARKSLDLARFRTSSSSDFEVKVKTASVSLTIMQ